MSKDLTIISRRQRRHEMSRSLSKFSKHLATIAEPLRKLTGKDVDWHWEHEQQNAFEPLKQCLISSEVIAYYNQNAETQLIVDGSRYGL